jgi:hypothetical protein
MSSDDKCTFCSKPIELLYYIDHLIHSCDSLSAIEKNRAQEAVDKLLCECRGCNNYVYAKGYENHRKEHHPHTTEPWHLIEPQLSCFCPFAPGTATSGDMHFVLYEHHALKECSGYINFITAHCRPPKGWPNAEVDRLKYWLRLLETRRKSRSTPDESVGENSGTNS